MTSFLIALAVLGVFSSFTALLVKRFAPKEERRPALLLFGFALILHVAVALVVFYGEVYPFGGGKGDSSVYHRAGTFIAEDIRGGNFSLDAIQERAKRTGAYHMYPAFLGLLYAATAPEELVGVMSSVWFAALAALFVFFLARELGASPTGAFFAGMAAASYPTLLYLGALPMREGLVAALVMLTLWLVVKTLKRFSWSTFAVLYLALGLLIHFRFYIGFVALFVVLVSFILLWYWERNRRLMRVLGVVLLLGLLPQFSGHGYYGLSAISRFISIEAVRTYREEVYTLGPSQLQPSQAQFSESPSPQPLSPPVQPTQAQPESSLQDLEQSKGRGSTVVIEAGSSNPLTFVANSLRAFLALSLGPFPWEFKYPRHFFALVETAWWYAVLGFIAVGVWRNRSQSKTMLPLILFGVATLGLLSLFLASNFGVYMRIRIPSFLALLALSSLAFSPGAIRGILSHMPHRFHKRTSMKTLFLFLLVVSLSIPALAYAYLDPGTGSMIVQVLIAAFAGSLYALKVYWRKILGVFTQKRNEETPSPKEDKRL